MIEFLQGFEWWFCLLLIMLIPISLAGYGLYLVNDIMEDKQLKNKTKFLYVMLIIIVSMIINIPFVVLHTKVFEMEISKWQFFILDISPQSLVFGCFIIGASFLDLLEEENFSNLLGPLFFLLLLFIVLLLPPAYSTYLTWCNVDSASRIEKKIEQMSELRQKLLEKNRQIIRTVEEYKTDINSLKEEIQSEKEKYSINTFRQANGNQRIVYDLSLIQRKIAYINKLVEINKRVIQGIEELEFLERQSADDLKIVRVIKGEEIKSIIEGIDIVIEKYSPDAKQLQIEINEKNLPSQEQIWNYFFGQINQ